MKFSSLKLLANQLTSKIAGANPCAERIMPYVVEVRGGWVTHPSWSPSRRHEDQIEHVFKLTSKLTSNSPQIDLLLDDACVQIDFKSSVACMRHVLLLGACSLVT